MKIGICAWTRELSVADLRKLTRHYHSLSAQTDCPRSFYHKFYYACASECERRGYNLDHILRSKS